MDGWKTSLSFWVSAYFQVRIVSFRESRFYFLFFFEPAATFPPARGNTAKVGMYIGHEMNNQINFDQVGGGVMPHFL